MGGSLGAATNLIKEKKRKISLQTWNRRRPWSIPWPNNQQHQKWINNETLSFSKNHTISNHRQPLMHPPPPSHTALMASRHHITIGFDHQSIWSDYAVESSGSVKMESIKTLKNLIQLKWATSGWGKRPEKRAKWAKRWPSVFGGKSAPKTATFRIWFNNMYNIIKIYSKILLVYISIWAYRSFFDRLDSRYDRWYTS